MAEVENTRKGSRAARGVPARSVPARSVPARAAAAFASLLASSLGLEAKFVWGGPSGASGFELPGSGGSGSGSSGARSSYAGNAKFSRWDMDRAITDGYEASEWVFACVNAISRHLSSVPWRASEFTDAEQKALFEWELKGVPMSQRNDFFKDAHKKKFRGKWGKERKAALKPLPNDPLEQLIENPNAFMTRQEFMERSMQHLLLGGNAIWTKVRGASLGLGFDKPFDVPFELWPLFPNAVEIERDGMVPTLYKYGSPDRTGKKAEFAVRDIVHFRLPDPSDAIWGVSPLMAAARAVDVDVMAARWQLTSFENRAIPDLLFSIQSDLKNGQRLTMDQYREAREMVAEQQASGSRAPWVLGNADIRQLSLSPVEMDFIRSRGFSRNAICSTFDVFPQVVKIMEGFSVQNMDKVMEQHWIETVVPQLNRLQGVINMTITPEFQPSGASSGASGGASGVTQRIAWYDLSGVEALTQNLMERIRAQKIIHTQGVPFKDLNERFDLGFDTDEMVGADEGFMPAGVVTVSQALAGEGGEGSANPDVPPEGGTPNEPGGPSDPQEPDPEDVIPQDPGEGVPDTLLASELAYFQNGGKDAHHGKRRWNAEQVDEWLESHGLTKYGKLTTMDDDFTYQLDVEEYGEIRDSGDAPVGEEYGAEGFVLSELSFSLFFYHGNNTQERRERLLRRVASWGYDTSGLG